MKTMSIIAIHCKHELNTTNNNHNEGRGYRDIVKKCIGKGRKMKELRYVSYLCLPIMKKANTIYTKCPLIQKINNN